MALARGYAMARRRLVLLVLLRCPIVFYYVFTLNIGTF